jgi:hypothetical protein
MKSTNAARRMNRDRRVVDWIIVSPGDLFAKFDYTKQRVVRVISWIGPSIVSKQQDPQKEKNIRNRVGHTPIVSWQFAIGNDPGLLKRHACNRTTLLLGFAFDRV